MYFNKGKIYKLVSSQTDLIYIGSTIREDLKLRFSNHKADYNKWLKGGSYVSSFELLKYNDCEIVLIEKYPCANKHQLFEKEKWYIDSNKEICVNKHKAFVGIINHNSQQDYNKQYRILFSDKIKQQKKDYA